MRTQPSDPNKAGVLKKRRQFIATAIALVCAHVDVLAFALLGPASVALILLMLEVL